MASKSFTINTEPHTAVIGDTTLSFFPEVSGAAFAGSYADLREAQKAITAAGDNVGSVELVAVSEAMREFLSSFMLDESAKVFDAMTLPERILIQLIEFISELYGSGGGNDRGGPSTAS